MKIIIIAVNLMSPNYVVKACVMTITNTKSGENRGEH